MINGPFPQLARHLSAHFLNEQSTPASLQCQLWANALCGDSQSASIILLIRFLLNTNQTGIYNLLLEYFVEIPIGHPPKIFCPKELKKKKIIVNCPGITSQKTHHSIFPLNKSKYSLRFTWHIEFRCFSD